MCAQARKVLRRPLIPEQNFHRKITPAVQQNSKATVVIISARTRRLKRALVRAIVIKWHNEKRYVQRFKQRIFLQKERQTMRKNLAAKKAELVNHIFLASLTINNKKDTTSKNYIKIPK